MTDGMNYIHVKFQDFQQKRTRGKKLMGMGKILDTNHKMTGTMTHNILLGFKASRGKINVPTYPGWGPEGHVP